MSIRELFQDLNEMVQEIVRIGDNNVIQVAGVGSINSRSGSGKVRTLN